MHSQPNDIELTDFTKTNPTTSSLSLSSSSRSTAQLISLSKNEPPSLVLKHCLYRSPTLTKKPALLLFHTPLPIALEKEYQLTNIASMTIKVHKILYFLGRYAFTRSSFITTEKEFKHTLLIPYAFLQLSRWQKFKATLCTIFTISPTLFEAGFLRELEVDGKMVLQKSFIN
jgi:hypothetical protein